MKFLFKYIFCFLFIWMFSIQPGVTHAQQLSADTLKVNSQRNKKLLFMTGVATACYGSNLGYLVGVWYKDFEKTPFHFFNDWDGWLQMDKMGHLTTAYQVAGVNFRGYNWTGINRTTSNLISLGITFAYMTGFEYMDGRSDGWGFSPADFAFNSTGMGLYFLQEQLLKKQIVNFKWMFHFTDYALIVPNKLGATWQERWLKDYNGQAYWLSFNIGDVLPESSRVPRWLCISLGYGVEGLLGYSSNPTEVNGVPIPEYDRYRQYYLSLDIDLSKIKTKSKVLHAVLSNINFIKIPFSAVEYNSLNKVKFHPIYF